MNLKTASVLAFERKLDPSDGLLSAGRWDNREQGDRWPGITIREKSVRGTISNRLKTRDQDPAKLDASIQSPNPQTVDVATLPTGTDTLRLRFTLRVLGNIGRPSACNNDDYRKKLHQTVEGYVKDNGLISLARRYAYNLANGRFLWRNRIGAEEVEVHVAHLSKGEKVKEFRFSGQNFSLKVAEVEGDTEIDGLAGIIGHGLAGEEPFTLLEVVAYARVGEGQEVFPSQELILDRENTPGKKSKTLYAVAECAAIHSQKLGNAIRTIDTWYPNPENEDLGPIAVEPYGSVTSQGKAYRQPREKADFYTLLDSWVLHDRDPGTQQHFVIANLIRGGVFGESEKE